MALGAPSAILLDSFAHLDFRIALTPLGSPVDLEQSIHEQPLEEDTKILCPHPVRANI